MKTYYDLQAIDQILSIKLIIEPVGRPTIFVKICNNTVAGTLLETTDISGHVNLLEPFSIEVELQHKDYTMSEETAILIKSLQVDDIDLIPKFTHLATYSNDKNHKDPSNYLGFNGKWTLTIDRPFYQWLHQATGQGWLLS
jgi:hypothetical protein